MFVISVRMTLLLDRHPYPSAARSAAILAGHPVVSALVGVILSVWIAMLEQELTAFCLVEFSDNACFWKLTRIDLFML